MSSAKVLTAAHMERAAYVYVRQSSEFQVRNNVGRQRLQYALADHAREPGFRDITVIDDDPGISGDGVHRPGFESLLEAVCKGKVGLALSIEASRLSRNGREWHTLLDFCAIVGCLVGDRDRLYDPALIDDRMYLGLEGRFNEMEPALFRQRSLESRIALAERGELRMHLPAGYGWVEGVGLEMTPDQRQRDAVRPVFRKFREPGSIRQVFLWFRDGKVEVPARMPGQAPVWKVPASSGPIKQILTNPIHAGACVYGRRRQETVIGNGRRRVRQGIMQHDPRDWKVLLRDHHEGCITWQRFCRNRELIPENLTTVRGAVRNGPELLTGLLRCGRCDRRIQVRDNGGAIRCRCLGSIRERRNCIMFGAVAVDVAVGEAVTAALQPFGIEAALAAMAVRDTRDGAEVRLAESALAEARCQAERAEAQFNAVEPGNHNVFHSLARKREDCLARVQGCESRAQALEGARQAEEPTPEEREAWPAPGNDLERAWNHDRATPELRRRILRAALVEITATVKGQETRLLLHWKGGGHTEPAVRRRRKGEHRRTADAEVRDLIRDLARCLPDEPVAGLLNRLGRKTGKGNGWTKSRVCSFRSRHGIAACRKGERRERGELILSEAAERLAADPAAVRRLIRSGALPARQACKGAPWIIREDALDSPEVLAALAGRSPLTANPDQKSGDFQ